MTHDEVERYEQLLNDWKPGPSQPRPSSFSRASGRSSSTATLRQPARAAVTAAPAAAATGFTTGAILLMQGGTVAIYDRFVPDKEYHLLLMLNPNGSVKAQGLVLEGYQTEELGSIPRNFIDKLRQEMAWDRDLLVFHCYSYEDVKKLPKEGGHPKAQTAPAAQAKPAAAAAAPQPAAGAALRRGQRLQVKFGNNSWDAVYWGRDNQGTVVAHKTNQTWALMHLDLERFSNGLVVDETIDQSLIQEIEQNLLAGQTA